MEKSELRDLYKEKRSELSQETRDQISLNIKEQLFNAFDFEGKTVSIFLPINKFKEVNTYPIFERLKTIPDCRIALSKSDFEELSMNHFEWTSNTEIIKNKWDIPEPKGGVGISNSEIDFVLIPMMICDLKGYRLGYGKGFYDRFLKGCRDDVVRVGLNYFPPIENLSHDEFDQCIQYLITGEAVYTFD